MRKLLIALLFFTAISCKESYTPKPYGYFRIDLPEKSWNLSPDSLPYQFDMSALANIETDQSKEAEWGWVNVCYPQYNAKIHLSHKNITTDSSLFRFTEDCHRLAYTHTIKAESINEKYFRKDGTFGMIYYIEGNTASSTQFFITDSTRHFLRGALYFNQHPDRDSLAPVINYLREDIVNLMETLQFRDRK